MFDLIINLVVCGECTIGFSEFEILRSEYIEGDKCFLKVKWRNSGDAENTRLNISEIKNHLVRSDLIRSRKDVLGYLRRKSLRLVLENAATGEEIASCGVRTQFLCNNSTSRSMLELVSPDKLAVARIAVAISVVFYEVISQRHLSDEMNEMELSEEIGEDKKSQTQLSTLINWGEKLVRLCHEKEVAVPKKGRGRSSVIEPPPFLTELYREIPLPKVNRHPKSENHTINQTIFESKSDSEVDYARALRVYVEIPGITLYNVDMSNEVVVSIRSRYFRQRAHRALASPSLQDFMFLSHEKRISVSRNPVRKDLSFAVNCCKEIIMKITRGFLDFSREGNLTFEIKVARKGGERIEAIGLAKMSLYPFYLFIRRGIDSRDFTTPFSLPQVIYNDKHTIENPLSGREIGQISANLSVSFAGEIDKYISVYNSAARTIQRCYRAYRYRKAFDTVACRYKESTDENQDDPFMRYKHSISISFVGILGHLGIPSKHKSFILCVLPAWMQLNMGFIQTGGGERKIMPSLTDGDNPSFNSTLIHNFSMDVAFDEENISQNLLSAAFVEFTIYYVKENVEHRVGTAKLTMQHYFELIRGGAGKMLLLSLPINSSKRSLAIVLHYRSSTTYGGDDSVSNTQTAHDKVHRLNISGGSDSSIVKANSFFSDLKTPSTFSEEEEDTKEDSLDNGSLNFTAIREDIGKYEEMPRLEMEEEKRRCSLYVSIEMLANVDKPNQEERTEYYVSFKLMEQRNAISSRISDIFCEKEWDGITDVVRDRSPFSFSKVVDSSFQMEEVGEWCILIFVWKKGNQQSLPVGFAIVDLAGLDMGLEEINGWYHLKNKDGGEVGQVKFRTLFYRDEQAVVKNRESPLLLRFPKPHSQPVNFFGPIHSDSVEKKLLRSNLEELEDIITKLPSNSSSSIEYGGQNSEESVEIYKRPLQNETLNPGRVNAEVDALFDYLNRKYSRIPLNK